MIRRMIRASAVACFAMLLLGGIAAAQSNLYGTLTCTPPPPAPEPDPPAAKTAQKQQPPPPSAKPQPPAKPQATSLQTCAWPEPIFIRDIGSRDAEATFHSEVNGNKSQDSAEIKVHMNNGEQVTLRFSGTSVLDADGSARNRQGTWTLSDGTGPFKGIVGQGTYAGLPRASGGTTYDLQGTYQLPSEIQKPPAPQGTPPQTITPPAQQPANPPKAKEEG